MKPVIGAACGDCAAHRTFSTRSEALVFLALHVMANEGHRPLISEPGNGWHSAAALLTD